MTISMIDVIVKFKTSVWQIFTFNFSFCWSQIRVKIDGNWWIIIFIQMNSSRHAKWPKSLWISEKLQNYTVYNQYLWNPTQCLAEKETTFNYIKRIVHLPQLLKSFDGGYLFLGHRQNEKKKKSKKINNCRRSIHTFSFTQFCSIWLLYVATHHPERISCCERK